MQPERLPLVSIVMATYNRSNILGYAIQSAQASTLQDWELIIVGDCCTDDSAEVVAAFADARIRFVNLESNFGEQTGPNNIGISLARGKYLAFLNHDDLWLPGHLQRNVEILESGAAELVFDQGLVVQQAAYQVVGALTGAVTPYRPWMDVPASLWVMRREVAGQVGPWAPSWELRCAPSQGWLHRAYRAGCKMVANPRIGAVLIQSGSRSNAYLDRQHGEHAFWFGHMQDEGNLLQILAPLYGARAHERQLAPLEGAREALKALVRKLFLVAGLWPPQPSYWFKYWRRGSFLRELRRRRGLHDITRR
jgi:glycosyltransferase involved in cell wall biosynthesis